ncbi:MAG: hypothetical protein HQK87_08230, partial [Nitrospinae bacterium]|nr:hypothetical protein [Nitrospinota bacterium]
MRLPLSFALSFALSTLLGCLSLPAPEQGGDRSTRLFDARTVSYSSRPTPLVMSRSFTTRQTVTRRGGVESYTFENFFGPVGDHPDTTVILALSGNSAGFGVYDAAGRPLLEIPKGSYDGASLTFVRPLDRGKQNIRWILGEGAFSSVVESTDARGTVFESEVTTYLPR